MKKTALAVWVLFGGAIAAAACSSSSSSDTTTPTADGGGADGTADVSSSSDGSGGNDSAPPKDAAGADPCAIQAAYDDRCKADSGVAAACIQARRAQCAQTTALDSQLIHDVTIQCASATSSCDPKAYSDCSDELLAKATPTTVQAAVRDHLCERCGGGTEAVATCKREFFYWPEAGGVGPGITVLVSSDALAKQIDDACAIPDVDGGTGDCQIDFYQCASDVYNQAQPTDPAICHPG
jgi:hypothetical protein